MSVCIALLARAGGLTVLLCISCMVPRLLLICDVESALSLLAVVVSLVSYLCGWRAGSTCRAELSRQLDGEVEGLVAHVGPCR